MSSEPPAPKPERDDEIDEEIEIEVEPEWRDERTEDLALAIGAPVPVLVVAGGIGVASRLRVGLGMDRIAAVTRTDLEGVERALAGGPLVVVVDATDVPRVSAEDLVSALAPGRAVHAVWGVDMPYGRRFVELCARAHRPCVGVRVADGIEPIFDLISSRRG